MTVSNKLTRKLLWRASAGWLTRNRPSPTDEATPPTTTDAGTRRTEITIETHRVLKISRSRAPETTWCEECGTTIQLLTIEEVAALCRVSTDFIYRLIEARYLHSIKQHDALVVCLQSLEAALSTDVDLTRILQRGETCRSIPTKK